MWANKLNTGCSTLLQQSKEGHQQLLRSGWPACDRLVLPGDGYSPGRRGVQETLYHVICMVVELPDEFCKQEKHWDGSTTRQQASWVKDLCGACMVDTMTASRLPPSPPQTPNPPTPTQPSSACPCPPSPSLIPSPCLHLCVCDRPLSTLHLRVCVPPTSPSPRDTHVSVPLLRCDPKCNVV